MTARFRFDPANSRFTVQAFSSGLLSLLGHSPTFAVRDFEGELLFTPGGPENVRLQITARADSLELIDDVRPNDRAEIVGRMRGEVLATAANPEITFTGVDSAARKLAEDRIQFTLRGALALHGVSREAQADAQLDILNDGIRLTGEFMLPMSAYGIRPVTALAGTIRLKDQVKVSFELAGRPE